MIVFPHAKINLGLNIVGVRPDGYHDIETVFLPIGYSDILEVTLPQEQTEAGLVWATAGNALDVPMEKNLCVRALNALRREVSFPTVGLHLTKLIPDGAGLGGGSSDAAFVLKTVNSLLHLDLPREKLMRMAASIGADCPFFIDGAPVLATGIGDVFAPVSLPALREMSVVVVVPAGAVSTVDAYRNVVCRRPSVSLSAALKRPVEEWKSLIRNDFEDYVASRVPDIAAFKEILYASGATYAQMSGSGSSVFAFFPPGVELPGVDAFAGARGYWSGALTV